MSRNRISRLRQAVILLICIFEIGVVGGNKAIAGEIEPSAKSRSVVLTALTLIDDEATKVDFRRFVERVKRTGILPRSFVHELSEIDVRIDFVDEVAASYYTPMAEWVGWRLLDKRKNNRISNIIQLNPALYDMGYAGTGIGNYKPSANSWSGAGRREEESLTQNKFRPVRGVELITTQFNLLPDEKTLPKGNGRKHESEKANRVFGDPIPKVAQWVIGLMLLCGWVMVGVSYWRYR